MERCRVGHDGEQGRIDGMGRCRVGHDGEQGRMYCPNDLYDYNQEKKKRRV